MNIFISLLVNKCKWQCYNIKCFFLSFCFSLDLFSFHASWIKMLIVSRIVWALKNHTDRRCDYCSHPDFVSLSISCFNFFTLGDAENPSSPEPEVLEGQGTFKLEGWWLKLSQFHGLIIKRFHCAKRNTKGLFSQILLPAFFVCVAMTVALSVPEIGEILLVLWWF